MKFREPMPWFDAYSAAWSYRAASGSDTIDVLYTEMHRANLDLFMTGNDPIFDFVVERWEAGIRPEQFERDFSRHWWVPFGRTLTRAVGTQVGAVRALLGVRR